MKPLVFSDPVAGALFFGGSGCWALAEVALAVRTTGGGGDSDRSHLPLFASGFAGFGLAIYLSGATIGPSLPGGEGWPVIAGLTVFGFGIALRAWAIRVLGQFFVFNVAIQEDHRVVDTGPYALIRHPGYAGLLLATLGLGVGLDNWLSLGACFLPPLIGFTRRMVIEEAVLQEQLGDPYRAYSERTSRLVPGLW